MGMTVEQITKYGRESKECMITEYELVLHVTRLLCVLLFGGLFSKRAFWQYWQNWSTTPIRYGSFDLYGPLGEFGMMGVAYGSQKCWQKLIESNYSFGQIHSSVTTPPPPPPPNQKKKKINKKKKKKKKNKKNPIFGQIPPGWPPPPPPPPKKKEVEELEDYKLTRKLVVTIIGCHSLFDTRETPSFWRVEYRKMPLISPRLRLIQLRSPVCKGKRIYTRVTRVWIEGEPTHVSGHSHVHYRYFRRRVIKWAFFFFRVADFALWTLIGSRHLPDSSSHVRPVNQNKWRRAIWNINAYA